MRHERINKAAIAAAAWPSTLEGLVLAEPEGLTAALDAEAPPPAHTPAAADIAPGVGRLIVAAYAGLVSVLFAFFTGSAMALFSVTIAAGFIAIFFAVPRIFLRVEPEQGRPSTLSLFMERGMETLTGHSSGRDALVQMLIVPVLLTFGLAAMGIAGAIYL